ncbi:MAG TPA: energy-coupled thiamine transporter ThiT [Coriobacteriia bacterium]|jgi:thiamine transporter
MNRSRLVPLVEAALTIALAAVLHFASRLWQMPAGGTISLEMLPVIVLALRRGVVIGVVAGALFGVVDLFLEPYVVHWVQFFLDYPIAFGALGVAGLARPLVRRAQKPGARRVPWLAAAAVLGSLLGGAARFASHFVSGAVFFASNAPKGQPVLIYSAVYNASYLVPSLIACALLAALVVPVLQIALPTEA